MAGARFSLEGQAAVVTGAGRGIGKAIALALAESGADVALLDRTVAELAETHSAVEALGRRALAVAADVSDVATVRRAATEILAFFDGHLDILVNNAGVVGRQS